MSRSFSVALVLLASALLAPLPGAGQQTAPRVVQPGSPGDASRTLTQGELAATERPGHVAADVRFMQEMIAHHEQAIVLTSMIPGRSSNQAIRMLALRIDLSQVDEIELMRRWLADRGEEVPGVAPADPMDHSAHLGHGAMDHALMPGMLTQGELDLLAASSGTEFDRLFLEFMIKHHEGALLMVEQLFASDGAAQEVDIFTFASHVEADQSIEIARMRSMLETLR